jgi:hypothetical protein
VTAIIAAVLFGIALLFKLLGVSVAFLTVQALFIAGLLCLALHLAGVGNTVRVRSHRRRRSV